MKRRILAVLLVVIMLMSVMTACGGNKVAGGNFVVPEGGYDGSAVTITFASNSGSLHPAISRVSLDIVYIFWLSSLISSVLASTF